MKILKKYFQNQKGLQKLDTKHVPHSQPKRIKKFEANFVTKEEEEESLNLDIDSIPYVVFYFFISKQGC